MPKITAAASEHVGVFFVEVFYFGVLSNANTSQLRFFPKNDDI